MPAPIVTIAYLLTEGLGNYADPIDAKYLLTVGLSFKTKHLVLNLLSVMAVD